LGFSHIDTAQFYRTEESAGKGIRESGLDRSEVYVTSKYSSGDIQETVRKSLSNLGLTYLDLYLIHFPGAVKDFESAWKEFEKIKKDGLAKSIGVSNFNLEQLQSLIKTAEIKPAVNQIELHPYNYAGHKSLIQYAILNNIVIEAYSSLAPITKYRGGPVDVPVNAAAKKRDVEPSQILLAWVRAKGAVIVTTSTKKEHLKQYLDSADIVLTDDEITAIDEAGARGPFNWKRRILPFSFGLFMYFAVRALLR